MAFSISDSLKSNHSYLNKLNVFNFCKFQALVLFKCSCSQIKWNFGTETLVILQKHLYVKQYLKMHAQLQGNA